ncbi:protein SRC2 [Cajanus cajan]|uniref:protein SRC2 n=1 Tax=Cajanus cajan TaxID=3821 RepID=UPI00098D89ED|nr:protein SRC2 [Cajanus cajan]
MASRYELEVKLTSARGLKNVNWRHGANRPYAVVWVDPNNKFSTRVDEDGDTEANWDQTLLIPLPPEPLEDLTLFVDVVHAGSESDTKPFIGSARLKLVDVLDEGGIDLRVSRSLTLKRSSGRPQGKVEVGVMIRESGYRARGGYNANPYGVREYSPAPQGYGYPYGAPPQENYYSAPQTASYGYAAPQTASYGQGSGYGYAAPEEKKKSKFGGMGTGLAVGAVAGVLGGVALVEGAEYVEDKIADDVAERVEDDLGYDDGDDF